MKRPQNTRPSAPVRRDTPNRFASRSIREGQLRTSLADLFSVAHDPTELNRQGPDTGTQYRSTIFPANSEQAKVATAYIGQLNAAHAFSKPIVTTVEPGRSFYAAEDYHQNFLTLNPTYPYIVINDMPKVENLKRLFPGRLSRRPGSRRRREAVELSHWPG